MKPIEIVILGTSSQFPTKDRNHISIFVRFDKYKFLWDCGEGTQRQMRIAGLSPYDIDALFISHWHGDHTLGIGGIIQSLSASGRTKPLLIYGPKGTKKRISFILNTYIFKRTFDCLVTELEPTKEDVVVDSKEFYISAFPLEHGVQCVGYNFYTKPVRKIKIEYTRKFGLVQHPLLGKLQKGEDIVYKGNKITVDKATYLEPGKKVSYIIDTRFNDNLVNYARDAELLICESTFIEEDKEKSNEYFHMTAREAATVASNAGVKKLVLTHISQRYLTPKIVEREAKEVFENSRCAKDFDKFIVK